MNYYVVGNNIVLELIMARRLTKVTLKEVSGVKRPANGLKFLIKKSYEGEETMKVSVLKRFVAIFKSSAKNDEAKKKADEMEAKLKDKKDDDDVCEDDVKKMFTDLSQESNSESVLKEISDTVISVLKGTKPEDDKNVPSSIQKQIDDMKAENARLTKSLSELHVSNIKKSFEEKVSVLKNVSVDASFTDALMALSDIEGGDKHVESIMKTLNAANEAAGKFMTTVGSSQSGKRGDVLKQVDKKVAEIMKGTKIKKSEAMVQIMKEEPELYKQYVAEMKGE